MDWFLALRPAFEWELGTSTPEGWLANVEDDWYKNTWLITVAAAYHDAPSRFGGSLGTQLQWRFFRPPCATTRTSPAPATSTTAGRRS